MPVRAMLYDAMNYAEQVQAITQRRRKDKPKQTRHEYLSGLGKDDRLKPVVTLVLNISGEYWDGCKSIHELLYVEDEHILQFVPNYKLNLLSPDLLTEQDFDKFRTGVGAAMQFLKHQHDDNMDWMDAKGELNVDRATAEFVQTATGTDFEINENGEVIDMCRAWKNSMKQAEDKGREAERKDAILYLIASIKDISASQTQAVEQLMKRYSLTKAEAQATVQANW